MSDDLKRKAIAAEKKAREKILSDLEAKTRSLPIEVESIDKIRGDLDAVDPAAVGAKGVLADLRRRVRKLDFRPRFTDEILDRVEAIGGLPKRLHIPTGFRDLDILTGGGITPGITVVGGRNGGGKTTMVHMIAESAACAGHPVLFVSFEETEEELIAHSLARWSGVDEREVFGTSKAIGEGKAEMRKAFGARLAYIDAAQDPISATEILDMTESICREGDKVPVVVVDHLQLLAEHTEALQSLPGRRRDLRETVNQVMREFIDATRRGAGICVVLVSQMSRSGYKDGADTLKRDSIGDFRESAAIESAAGLAFAMKPRDDGDDDGKKKRTVAVHIVKNRRGPVGKFCVMEFDGKTRTLAAADLEGKADARGWRPGKPPEAGKARAEFPKKNPANGSTANKEQHFGKPKRFGS